MKHILNKLAKNLLFKQLNKIEYGTIKLIEKNKTYTFGNDNNLIGTIIIKNHNIPLKRQLNDF